MHQHQLQCSRRCRCARYECEFVVFVSDNEPSATTHANPATNEFIERALPTQNTRERKHPKRRRAPHVLLCPKNTVDFMLGFLVLGAALGAGVLAPLHFASIRNYSSVLIFTTHGPDNNCAYDGIGWRTHKHTHLKACQKLRAHTHRHMSNISNQCHSFNCAQRQLSER